MDFGMALNHIRIGAKVRRYGWNGPNLYIGLFKPDSDSDMTKPYLYIASTVDHDRVPWAPSQTDVLSVDWTLV